MFLGKICRVMITFSALLCGRDCNPQVPLPEISKYLGGRSTSLQAIIRTAMANKIPLGIVLGARPFLCGREHDYNFRGKSVNEALRASVEGTSYELSSVDGIFRISAPDLSPGERKTLAYVFPTFASGLDTMSGVGAWLTGWIQDVIEGSGGFGGSHLGGTDDEHLHLPELREVTPPQIADAVVKMKGHGFWVMQAHDVSSPPKPGSTQMSIYSYHDLGGAEPAISCVEVKKE